MDAINELLKSVDAEDKARGELWNAQNRTRQVVRENMTKLMDSGLVKLEINRVQLRRMVGQAPAKASVPVPARPY